MQEHSPFEQRLSILLRSKDSRTRIIKSLHEALTALNLPSSVRALEKQSRLLMQEERLRIIRNHLRGFQYDSACEQVMQLELPMRLRQEIVRDLMDLQLDYWLSLGKQEEVLEQLWQREVSEARRLQLCEMIALGTSDIQLDNIRHCHELILQRCEQEGKEQFNVRRALAQYLDIYESRPAKSTSPPNNLIAQSQAITLGRKKVNFVKLNHNSDRIAVLIQGETDYGLTVFSVNGHLIKKEMSLMGNSLGWVNQMKWSRFNHTRQCIGICSYDKVVIVNAIDELSVVLIIERTQFSLERFLCFEWHPVSEILYIGGLFDKIIGVDSLGELITQLNPYCKTRQIVFSPQGKLFTIGATKQGHLIRYSLEEERVETRLSANGAIFMDLRYNEGFLVATSKEFIYVIDAQTMTVVNLIGSPPNERLYKIEAFLCNSWVIVFNQTLRGVRQQGGVLMRNKWHNCQAVDVQNHKMITFQTSLRLWDCNPLPSRHRKRAEYEMIDEYSTPHRPVHPIHPHSPSSSSSSSSDQMQIEEMEQEESSGGEYQFEEMIELPLENHLNNHNLI